MIPRILARICAAGAVLGLFLGLAGVAAAIWKLLKLGIR